MKSNMLKRKQIVRKFLSLFSLTLVISATIYAVQAYSFSIGLFNDFDIQISGNDYINTLLIKSEIYPQINSSLLSINLPEIPSKTKVSASTTPPNEFNSLRARIWFIPHEPAPTTQTFLLTGG